MHGSTRPKGELHGGIVDTGHVDGSGRLVFLWLESKGVHVDTDGRTTGVMLVWLNQIEVSSLSGGESILSVEEKLGIDQLVSTRVGEVTPSLGGLVGGELTDPDNLLTRVIEVEFLSDGGGREGFGTGKL